MKIVNLILVLSAVVVLAHPSSSPNVFTPDQIKRENVTVISGNFKVGIGDNWEDSKLATFAPGSFAYVDPDMHHYAMSGETETIVQVHGMSPLQFNNVNPDDDLSKKK